MYYAGKHHLVLWGISRGQPCNILVDAGLTRIFVSVGLAKILVDVGFMKRYWLMTALQKILVDDGLVGASAEDDLQILKQEIKD